ncbi:DUF465 domain-containing protein [uncultured Erythrobacter sp.]|uniref:YdcH family protein n=1 Tax=uncultured Erythrobacter sp. TaxID=263913 RepID=UPI00262B0D2B|nr:DUF465 domain-containing protein [uncultured Erythrobacter sp.]
MSAHTPHELHDEFPHDAETLRRLKSGNAHFCKLADRYHAVNRAIHRIEAEIEPCSDEHTDRLKKQRLSLLDEIAALLEKAEANLVHA